MSGLVKNCIIIGIFTIFIGIITEKTLYKFNRKNNFLSRLKRSFPQFICTLFLFGIVLHLFFEYSGLEAGCSRKCDELTKQCKYVCEVKMNDIFIND